MVGKDDEVENIKIIDFGFSNYLSKLLDKKGEDGTQFFTQISLQELPTILHLKCCGRSPSTSKLITSRSVSSSTLCTDCWTQADRGPPLQRLHNYGDPVQYS